MRIRRSRKPTNINAACGSLHPEVMSEAVNEQGVPYPLLMPGCTACKACYEVCPDFVFEVFRYQEPVLHEFEEGTP